MREAGKIQRHPSVVYSEVRTRCYSSASMEILRLPPQAPLRILCQVYLLMKRGVPVCFLQGEQQLDPFLHQGRTGSSCHFQCWPFCRPSTWPPPTELQPLARTPHDSKSSAGTYPQARLLRLDDIPFDSPPPFHEPIEGEDAEVNGLVLAFQNELCEGSAHCWRLLQPMAREAVGKVEVLHQGVRAYHRALVKGVVVIVTSPRTLYLPEGDIKPMSITW